MLGGLTISAERPVTRQAEAELHRYSEWQPYWESPMPGPGADALDAAQALMRLPRNLSKIVLGVWLVLWGLLPLLRVSFSGEDVL
jgi:hypothetical protein